MERVDYRPSFLERAVFTVVAWVIRALGATFRHRIDGEEVIDETLAAGSSVILFTWHELFLVAAACDLRHHHPAIMISRSRDGERIARVAEKIGIPTVRGSSSRGGARALLEMVRALREPMSVAHFVDGPRGPRHDVKPGLVAMAQRSRAPLVPVAFAISRKWTAPSWDRHQVPLPFARVAIRLLPARCVPADLDEAEAKALSKELGDELERACAALESELSGQSAPAPGRSS